MKAVLKPVEVTAVCKKGNGVKAARAFNKGELIMSSPAKKFSIFNNNLKKRSNIFKYLFVRPGDKDRKNIYMVCGAITFFNHSSRPNVRVEWIDDVNGITWLNVFATQKIVLGEELEFFYTNIDQYEDIEMEKKVSNL